MTHGGQIVMSHAAHHKLLASAGPDAPLSLGARVVSLGKFELPDVPNGMHPHHGATSQTRRRSNG